MDIEEQTCMTESVMRHSFQIFLISICHINKIRAILVEKTAFATAILIKVTFTS